MFRFIAVKPLKAPSVLPAKSPSPLRRIISLYNTDYGQTNTVFALQENPDTLKDVKCWCAREDLNLHPLRDQILSLACLPFHHSRQQLET